MNRVKCVCVGFFVVVVVELYFCVKKTHMISHSVLKTKDGVISLIYAKGIFSPSSSPIR